MKHKSPSRIARKYAEALAQIRLDEQLLEELDLISKSFAEDSELSRLMANPSLQHKEQILETCFASTISKESMSLLQVLAKRRRLSIVVELGAAYREAYYKHKGISKVELSSARELSQTELAAISSQLEAQLQTKVQISNSLDPSLIAGYRLDISGQVLDSSLKARLKELRQLVK